MQRTLPRLVQVSSAPFKRSQTGLFHGKLIQFGNNVPFSKQKTRRTWLPNIQQKGLRSTLLNRELTLKVSTKALKTIKKLGGLDEYILNTRSELLGPEGMRIKMLLRDKQVAAALAAAHEARERARLQAIEAERERAMKAEEEARALRESYQERRSVSRRRRRDATRARRLFETLAQKAGPKVRMLKLERKNGRVQVKAKAEVGKEEVAAKSGAVKAAPTKAKAKTPGKSVQTSGRKAKRTS
ncbi:hypothetical protein M0805_000254 [Coniferiporia weirii]|nr:hypothetical protein M0805_000254 [Coniferiporia weirii]